MTGGHSYMSPQLRAAALELVEAADRARLLRRRIAMQRRVGTPVDPHEVTALAHLERDEERASQVAAIALANDETPPTPAAGRYPWRVAITWALAGYAVGALGMLVFVTAGYLAAAGL